MLSFVLVAVAVGSDMDCDSDALASIAAVVVMRNIRGPCGANVPSPNSGLSNIALSVNNNCDCVYLVYQRICVVVGRLPKDCLP
jgi:hypothetical protein